MKSKLTLCALAVGFFAICATMTPQRSRGQSEDLPPQVLALLNEVQQQQATIVANQDKIDAAIATITEDIRLARIFVSRAGPK